MKSIVLGSSGLVGSYSCQLLSEDFEVIPVSKSSPQFPVDLAIPGKVEELVTKLKPEVVVNCTKVSMSADEAESKKELTWALNFQVPYQLSKLQKKLGFKLIHLSTDWVYEGKEGVTYSEEALTYPQNYYTYTKLLADEFIMRTCEDYVILRPECIFGLDKRGGNIFSRVMKAAKERTPIYFSKNQYAQPIYAKVLAKMIHKASKTQVRGLFNAVGPDYLSRYELALQFCEFFGWDNSNVIDLDPGVRPIKVPLHLKLSIGKANREFFPMPTLQEQLKELKQEVDKL